MDDKVDALLPVEQLREAGTEVSKQIPALCKLGEWYLKKAKTTASESDFTKADALLNAALVRCRLVNPEISEGEILERIVEIHHEFLLTFTNYERILQKEIRNEIGSHREWIAHERHIIKERVVEIDTGFNRSKKTDDEYVVHAEKMHAVFGDIQDMYTRLVSMLTQECETILGEPPCDYVIIALGSVARMEATPFSDLEFAILYSDQNIGDKISYFRVLSHFLHLKVINLGETILPALAIEELNDFQSLDPNDNWFYDSETPRGISFDGAMPWASKTPMGRKATKDKPALELIKTPEEMAELQDEEIAIKEGYHLADIMSRASFVYGKKALLDEYNDRVFAKLNTKSSEASTTEPTVGFVRGIHQMMLDIRTYHPFYSYLGPYAATGGLFDAKKQFYRLISLLLSDLGLIFDIRAPSPWQVISELQTREIIDESEGANIKVCLSIANEMRLKTYLRNNGQKEVFSPVPEHTNNAEQSADDSIFRDFDEDTLVRLLSISNDVGKCCLDFALKYFEQQEVDTSILRSKSFCSSKSNDAHLFGSLYSRLQNFPKALHWMELEPKDSRYYSICLNDQGVIYTWCGEYERSVECFENALEVHYQNEENSTLNVLSCTSDLAQILKQMGKYEEARIKLEEMIKKHDGIHGEGSQTLDLHTLMVNLGGVYHEQGDIKLAIETYKKAEAIQERLSGIPDMCVIHFHLYIALALVECDQRGEAARHMKQALKLGHKVFGETNLSIKLAEIYVFAGNVFQQCNMEDEALALLKRSLQLLHLLLGDKPHPGKVSSLDKLGVFFYRKHQTKKAVEYFESALSQARIVFEGKRRVTVANILNSLGMALKRSEKPKEALACFYEAKEIMDKILGAHHVHPITSSILTNLVAVYQVLGDLKEAKEYCTKAVEINRNTCKTIDTCPSVVFRLFTLSEICEALGEKDEALKHLEEAQEILKISGSKHPILVKILTKLIVKYFVMGSLAKCMMTVQETVQISKSFSEDGSCPPFVQEVLGLLNQKN